ncbi:response regulator [Paenibacillus daejeonensis]|uniref:response regulator n=1 Tax=Paenibacillus daejeonensis TaxID=135193 RepID=UPI0003712B77|nr:response regulator [Paenibacillus daejeonensis]
MNVLVVDDDKLVRKGLISAMPWDKYGLHVVGEAKNGEKALEQLETLQVDLLLTDLAMPVMSGMELMRAVRKQYPHIFIVVLTLHQDFEYIQEALRLGAIDYIAKVQLEEEQFDEVLARICGRIAEEQRRYVAPAAAVELTPTLDTPDRGLAVIDWEESGGNGDSRLQSMLATWSAVASGLYMTLEKNEEERRQVTAQLKASGGRSSGLAFLRLSNMSGLEPGQLERRLIAYRSHDFFYEWDPQQAWYDVNLAQVAEQAESLSKPELLALRERWQSLAWLHLEERFEKLLSELKAVRMPPAQLLSELELWVMAWHRFYAPDRLELPDRLTAWTDVSSWLRDARDRLAARLSKPLYSPEVREVILQAAWRVHERLAEPLQATTIARESHMSRSYFSQCFKDILGMPFNEYVRYHRMEQAKAYLRETNHTVLWVAEQIGYTDEKYFSRRFREQTGVLPSEYRQQCKRESEMTDI